MILYDIQQISQVYRISKQAQTTFLIITKQSGQLHKKKNQLQLLIFCVFYIIIYIHIGSYNCLQYLTTSNILMQRFDPNQPSFSNSQDSPIFPVPQTRSYSLNNSLTDKIMAEKEEKIKKSKKPKKKKHRQEVQEGQFIEENKPSNAINYYVMTNSDVKFHISVNNFGHLNQERKNYVKNTFENQLQDRFGKIQRFDVFFINDVEHWLIGFQKDTVAFQFLGNCQQYKITFNDKTSITLMIQPTEVFSCFWESIGNYCQARKRAPIIQKENLVSIMKKQKFIVEEVEKSQRSFQRSGELNKNQNRENFKKPQNKPSFIRQLKSPKSLLIWGIPIDISKRAVVPQMKKIGINIRNVGNSKWVRVAQSYSQFLEIQIQSAYIDEAHQRLSEFRLNDQLCLVTQAPHSHSQIAEILNKYQVKIIFSKPLNNSLVYRALDNIFPVVDICKVKQSSHDGENSATFYVTFAKRQAVQQILNVGNKIEGVIIVPADQSIYIYRRIKYIQRAWIDFNHSQNKDNQSNKEQAKQAVEHKINLEAYESKGDFDY